MKQFENISQPTPIERFTLPEKVLKEVQFFEDIHKNFHPFRHIKSCTSPDECVYSISGTDIPENSDEAIPGTLKVILSKGNVHSTFSFDTNTSI